MLGDVEIKKFASRTKTLVAGRGIKSTLAYLRTKGTQGNVEAQAICTSVDSWIEAEMASAKALALTSPSQAVEKYALLSKTLTGLQLSTAKPWRPSREMPQICDYLRNLRKTPRLPTCV